MIATINPSTINGSIQAPASKSSMQRALAAALLIKGRTTIYKFGHSNDDKAALKLIEDLGAAIKIEKDKIVIESKGVSPVADKVNCGESGLAIRMFSPIIALSEKKIIINGEGSLLSRPMDFFDSVFPQLKIKIKSNNGKLPLHIQGPLQPKNIEVDGSLSSQFLTGLLMSFSAADANKVSIKVNNLKSKPYIELTLDVMKKFGMKVPINKNNEEFYFDDLVHASQLTAHEYTVEGDWSGASFLLVAGTIAGPITVRGLDLTSSQADKAIVDALMSANAGIAMEAKGIKIHPAKMSGFNFDATDCPDLFPPLVALAAYCSGKTTIKGVSRLVHKESNRAITLQEEFKKMGVAIELSDDVMMVSAPKIITGARFQSHHDHRIAMACTVAALKANGTSTVEDALAVKKSYPDFYTDLKTLGADVSLPYHQYNL